MQTLDKVLYVRKQREMRKWLSIFWSWDWLPVLHRDELMRWCVPVVQSWWGRDRRILVVFWVNILAELVNTNFRKRFCLKQYRVTDKTTSHWPSISTYTHIQRHMHFVCSPTHTHTPRNNTIIKTILRNPIRFDPVRIKLWNFCG